MRVDGGVGVDLETAGASARETEAAGYDGAWSAETGHDPFLPLLLAAEHTERLELGTGIAVAFARNPMNLASMANDLQAYSKGRFMLGLGSQIKPHIEKRFSMPWSHPAARTRELILAMRAIWGSWNEGTRLDFKGDFYTHTLMTPFFNPGPNRYGAPKVFLAAVGELMTTVAGEVADGLLAHGFTTERYLREATIPALERGLAVSGRRREDVQVSYPAFVVTGTSEAEMADAARGVRAQIAFYGSTPAYRPVLELHGWGELQTQLNTLSKQGEWMKMAELIDDDVLQTFAVVAEPEDVPARILARVGDVVDRITFYAPYRSDPERWRGILAGFKQPGPA
ncbi:MAG TPA: LLM class F420-dependent oxidoreductase [Acidimicrobiales bacterium]|nr:LLM class F420-dependent oxidoreductase [Acidimicrobiales bacterium]